MLDLLQRDSYLQLTEVLCLLGLQGIFIASCTMQLWMHGLVVSVLILNNWLANESDDGSDLPYDCAISATLTCCLSSILDNIFHDYGTLSEKNTPKGKRKEAQENVIGAFLAVSPKGTVFYWTTTSYTNGYWYGVEFYMCSTDTQQGILTLGLYLY
ncbi:hypothetical protein DSO57_1029197 [Entomophthora muscae]|uniref:Uncharacterized protein n=1 Tax=Entomophthora muscae TaxID=34485 RepID=A0ACC2U0R2_9FUNG|nr:hypothetical protein DSO57_1029197 [Entomophthora muscae]